MPTPPMNRRQPIRMCCLGCLIWILSLGSASAAAPPSAPESAPAPISESGRIEVSQGEPASLTFWNREIAILRADIGGISPAERVRRIQGKITDVLVREPGNTAEAVRSTFANLNGFWVQIDGHPVFGLVPEDADAVTGETVDEQVRRVVDVLQEALDARREQRSLPLILDAVLVGSPITNYSRLADERGAVVGTKVTIGYDTPWRQVHAMLTLAAGRTSLVRKEPAPFVLQRTLADFYPEYELFVHIDRPEQRFFALSELHGHIQDVFNEYGVQIMSPNFVSQPDQKVWVPEQDWYAAPAAPETRTARREL
ncbi:mechanosensitive ion channel domain-containing protein [Thiocapsa rosea]|uniref:Small-conductance mechanosensitive channel n=1 Tax=Thiocapsa rosea TaxID=69360 RepID=A0A495V9V2_9GAMM|nr:mechanosensitive ion channel domain-containing protein [Thiocapsa rosea]RKT46172.1 mechanosensitive ion channel-like protein [Thiocapsa rosea]